MGKSSGGGDNDMATMMSAMAAMQAAQLQYQLGHEQLTWAKDVYNQNYPYILQNAQQSLAGQALSNRFAQTQYDTYMDEYLPMEREYNRMVREWDTPERQQQMAGQAQSMVASQFEQARNAATQQLESFGVDPTSTRYAALDIGTRTAQAAAAAGQGTQAIQDTRLQGMGLRAGAINTGRGYANAVPMSVGAGTGAGSGASSGLTNYYGTGANAQNSAVGWFNAGNQAMGNAINGFSNAYSNQTNRMNARNQQSSGIGSALGLIGSFFDFNEGGEVPPQPGPALPPPPGGTTGGAVPMNASPSGGQVTDDVNARLNAGEFVIPRDVVEWAGEKAMYDFVDKARAAREKTLQETETKPEARQAIPGPISFQSMQA